MTGDLGVVLRNQERINAATQVAPPEVEPVALMLELDVLCTISDLEAGREGVEASAVVDAMAGPGRTPETVDELLSSLEQRHLVVMSPCGPLPDRRTEASQVRRNLRLTRQGSGALALGAAGWFVEPVRS